MTMDEEFFKSVKGILDVCVYSALLGQIEINNFGSRHGLISRLSYETGFEERRVEDSVSRMEDLGCVGYFDGKLVIKPYSLRK
jgi:hypothetical protein